MAQTLTMVINLKKKLRFNRDLMVYSLYFLSSTGCKGSVINIMIDQHQMVSALPRKFNQVSVVQVMLKRMLQHKTYYKYDTVSVSRINEVCRLLQKTPLFNDIKLIEDQYQEYDHLKFGDKINFVADESNLSVEELETMKKLNDEFLAKYEILSTANDDSSYNRETIGKIKRDMDDDALMQAEMEGFELEEDYLGRVKPATELLVYNMSLNETLEEFAKKHNIIVDCDEEKPQNEAVNNELKTLILAPGEGKTPVSARTIEFYEELAFPK
jgi:hypothetical protein